MNLAHVHLILNHIPVVGIPMALAFLIYGILKKDWVTQRFALIVLAAVAAVVVPVYLSGHAAEDAVERRTGVSESLIEVHEDAALAAIVLSVVVGISAFATLWLKHHGGMYRFAVLGTVMLTVITIGSLGYTPNLGGKIRHSEIRSTSVVQADAGGNADAQKSERD